MKKITVQVMGWLMVAAWSFMPLALQAQDHTVSGNLTVDGTSDLWGNNLYFGTLSGSPDTSGLTMTFTDGTTTTLSLNATSSANIWQWQENAGATLALQMSLDNNNKLTLYDQSSTPNANVVLDPLGTSSFANSLTVNGTDNEMPNQTLVNANSVLTEGLVDYRYVSTASGSSESDSSDFEMPYQTLTGSSSVLTEGLGDSRYLINGSSSTSALTCYASELALPYQTIVSSASVLNDPLGDHRYLGIGWLGGFDNVNHSVAMGQASASGSYSIAMGYLSLASGDYATAMGNESTASGSASTAAGNSSVASGDNSVAMGSSVASATNAAAIGYATTASGTNTAAFNDTTTATAYDSLVIGSNNVGGGNSTHWVGTDPLFEIGNGMTLVGMSSTYTSPSDALVVYKNGSMTVQGPVTTAPGGNISMYPGY